MPLLSTICLTPPCLAQKSSCLWLFPRVPLSQKFYLSSPAKLLATHLFIKTNRRCFRQMKKDKDISSHSVQKDFYPDNQVLFILHFTFTYLFLLWRFCIYIIPFVFVFLGNFWVCKRECIWISLLHLPFLGLISFCFVLGFLFVCFLTLKNLTMHFNF